MYIYGNTAFGLLNVWLHWNAENVLSSHVCYTIRTSASTDEFSLGFSISFTLNIEYQTPMTINDKNL